MSDVLSTEVLEKLRGYIERDVAAGFLSPDEIVQSAVEVLEGEADEGALQAEAVRLCEEAMAAHEDAQSSWPSVTDCDKLDQAFEELEALGVVARHNFTCCGTCGAAEIVGEMESAVERGSAVEGYTFYHAQDTEAAAEGHGIYLNYGSADNSEDGVLAVGQKVVATLSRHGLAPSWDGSLEKRIAVPLDWKRRRQPSVITGRSH